MDLVYSAALRLPSLTVFAVIASVLLLVFGSLTFKSMGARRGDLDSRWDVEPTRTGSVVYFCVVLGLVICYVLLQWASDTSSHFALANFIPIEDAVHYFQCARQVLDGEPLLDFCQRRPFPIVALGTFLAVADRKLDIALLLQAAYVSTAMFLLSHEVWRQFGLVVSAFAGALLFAFVSPFLTSVMTEPLGLALGALGLTVLLRYCDLKSVPMLFLGMLLLTVALHSRPGAFFVLPFLAIWSALELAGSHRRKIGAFAVSVAAVVAGTGLSPLMNGIYGTEIWEMHSNFAYHFYGIAVGGKEWTQAMVDFPELTQNEVIDTQSTSRIYEISFLKIAKEPSLFFTGILKGLTKFLQAEFGYAGLGSFGRPLLWLLWGFGVWTLIRGYGRRVSSFLLAAVLGGLISAPFISDGGLRVFAATIGVNAIVAGLGLDFLVHKVAKIPTAVSDSRKRSAVLPIVSTLAGVILLLSTILGPLILRGLDPLRPVKGAACPEGKRPVAVRLGKESPYVYLSGSDGSTLSAMVVSRDRFVANMERLERDQMKTPWHSLTPGATLIDGYQRLESGFGKRVNILWYTDRPPRRGAILQFCVDLSRDRAFRSFSRARLAVMPQ